MSLLDLKPNLRPFSATDYWTVAEGVTPPAFDAATTGVVQGVMDNLFSGTIIKDAMTPDLDTGERVGSDRGNTYTEPLAPPSPSRMDESQWKASEFAREGLKWEQGMTRERAAALADLYDESQYRQTILNNAKGGAYLAGLAGQFLGAATDPINYIPVLGPASKAAAVAKFGRIGGGALVAGGDAALNTAIAGLATRPARAAYGDDVSWTSFAIDVAMGAAIGGMFGAGAGAWERLRMNRQANTLPRVAEAQAAFNEAVGDIVTGRPVQMSDATIAAMRKGADELAPVIRNSRTTENAAAGIQASERNQVLTAQPQAASTVDGAATRAPEIAAAASISPKAALVPVAEIVDASGMRAQAFGEPLPAKGLAPANVASDGNVYVGRSGGQHFGIAEAFPDLAGEWIDTGFVTPDGRYLNRAEAFDWVEAQGAKLHPSENMGRQLDALDYREQTPASARQEGALQPPAAAATIAPRAIDPSPAPAPEPDPRAIEAAASVGRPVSGEQALADDLGIDIETGDSPVMMELEQLRQAGRLTAEDEAMLAEIEADAARADAIGEGLKAAAICRMN